LRKSLTHGGDNGLEEEQMNPGKIMEIAGAYWQA
jgi:hypothetical protein